MSSLTTLAQRRSTSSNKRTAALLSAAEGILSPGNSSVKRSKWKDVDLLTRKNKPSSLLPSSSTDYIDDNQDLLLAGCLSDLNDMGDAVVGDAGGINPTNGINSSCTIDASNITDILMDESVVCDAGGINPLDVSISQFLEDVFQDEDGSKWDWKVVLLLIDEGDTSIEKAGRHIAHCFSKFTRNKDVMDNPEKYTFNKCFRDPQALNHYLLDLDVAKVLKSLVCHQGSEYTSKEDVIQDEEVMDAFFGTSEVGRAYLEDMEDEDWDFLLDGADN